MGTENSKLQSSSSSGNIAPPSGEQAKDGVVVNESIPTLNYSRPGLVVVSAGPQDHHQVTPVTKRKEEEKDIILKELDKIPSFLPLIKQSAKGWEKYPAEPFTLEPLQATSCLELCRGYQDFLRKSTSIAVQEQKFIGNNIKKLELITGRTLECIGGRASELKRFEVRFRDVGVLAKQLHDVKSKIEQVVDSMQKLNMLLPPDKQLEKLSFFTPSGTANEVHDHRESCKNESSSQLIYPVSGICSLQGRRPTMEDTHVALDCLHFSYEHLNEHFEEHLGFWAVYDGHGGVDTAVLAEKILHDSIVQSGEFFAKNIQQAIEEAYLYSDRVILQKSKDEKWRNGSTAVTVLLVGNKLFTANAGDSEAVLGRRINKDTSNLEYEPILLTKKHTPVEPSERVRIERAGGTVFHGRVLGSLAVSRALGDLNFKEIPMVIPDPHINEMEMKEEDEFLIIACDGLWDVMTYDEAVEYVAARRQIDNISAKDVSEELANDAITKRGSSDNVSVIVVYLRPQYS